MARPKTRRRREGKERKKGGNTKINLSFLGNTGTTRGPCFFLDPNFWRPASRAPKKKTSFGMGPQVEDRLLEEEEDEVVIENLVKVRKEGGRKREGWSRKEREGGGTMDIRVVGRGGGG
jgi:hypothetical protein